MKWIMLLFTAIMMTYVSSAIDNAQNTIEVWGISEIYVAPDEAVINLGIKVWNEDMDEARQIFYEKSNNLSNLLKKYSIEDKYVKTDNIMIEPTYKKFEKMYYEGDIVNGYRFSKRISVTIKDISQVENILSEIIYSGATNLYGVDYGVSEHRKHADNARKQAITAAKEKAELLAGEIGQKVGKAIKINEPNYDIPWGRQSNVLQMGSQTETVSDIQPGMIRISASVNVIFELK
jgi:uncharacterized protein YggE